MQNDNVCCLSLGVIIVNMSTIYLYISPVFIVNRKMCERATSGTCHRAMQKSCECLLQFLEKEAWAGHCSGRAGPAHQLITKTPTRWGSQQQMTERILEQEKALTQVLRADRKTRHLVLTWQDIDVLESVSKALSPLIAFTDALSGEQYVSVSYLKPVLHLFKICWPIHLLDMASLLDPRFKINYKAREGGLHKDQRCCRDREPGGWKGKVCRRRLHTTSWSCDRGARDGCEEEEEFGQLFQDCNTPRPNCASVRQTVQG